MTRPRALVLRMLILCAMLLLMSSEITVAQDSERPLLLAHYMPWYQTPEISGSWGWHWTMDHFHPSQQNAEGQPDIASHYLPLTGPYDSQDDTLLEYQVLLMKLSGIDGVIVDWYGFAHFRDYAQLNDATLKLFDWVQKAGLRFVICYEDQTVGHMVDSGYLSGDQALAQGQDVMQYMDEHWFNTDAYVWHDGQPLLFVFGPQYFRDPAQWDTMAADLAAPPALVTLDGHMDWAALSAYPWPPMHMAGGRELLTAALTAYLDLFYRNARRRDYIVTSAFPGFHDIYAEADVRSSYGYLDPQDGATLQMTLDRALELNPAIVQLVTWNDYGEGTMIEPTEQTGYRDLEIVQQTRRQLDASGFDTPAEALRLPLRLFNARKAHKGDTEAQAALDSVFEAILAGDLDSAAAALNAMSA